MGRTDAGPALSRLGAGAQATVELAPSVGQRQAPAQCSLPRAGATCGLSEFPRRFAEKVFPLEQCQLSLLETGVVLHGGGSRRCETGCHNTEFATHVTA